MDLRSFIYFLLIFGPTSGQLSFLTAVDRLNTSYTDYYFCCNYIGRFILWGYNNKPLSGFSTNEVGNVLFDERNDYTYAATLLSSQPTFNGESKLDSVLVISFHNDMIPGNFSVTCNSNRNVSTVFPKNMSTAKNSIAKGADIRLDYVVSEPKVRRGHPYLSHIFICGVRQAPQFVEVTGTPLRFSSSDHAGQARTLFSNDRNTAIVQGILMARDNLISVALIIVSLEASVVNVTCYDRENIVILPSVEAVSSDNQVVTVDGGTMQTLPADDTTETMQTTEFLQSFMEESTNFIIASQQIYYWYDIMSMVSFILIIIITIISIVILSGMLIKHR